MNKRGIFGIVAAVIGIALFFSADTIAKSVVKGDIPADANSRPRIIGRRIARSQKADQKNQALQRYIQLSNNIDTAAVVIFVVGVGFICISCVHKKK